MKCAKACRELLWLSRFGELGPSSEPHLDHLAGCAQCREEVGFDRAMVQQLRIALAERIETGEPSPHAWEVILERAQLPEPGRFGGVWRWSSGLVGRLRVATAMAGTGLAVILALNMDVVPVAVPDEAASRGDATSLQQVPRIPTDRTALVPYLLQSRASTSPARPDPEAALTQARTRVVTRPPSAVVEEPSVEAPTQLRVVFRSLQTPDPRHAGAGQAASAAAAGSGSVESSPPLESAPGEPS